jgi:nucleotide-binding universal stress UspA family protein
MRGKGGGQMIEYPKYKKILFCTDFSENADYAFNFAFGIAKRDDGLLYLLHVIPGNPQEALLERFMPGNVVEQMHNVMKEDVDEKFREHYVNNMEKAINFETITKSGREAEEILKLARQEQMDIIVMGTHGSTGVEYVFFGSVAERVIRRSPFPVFIIPSRKKA